LVGRRTNTDDRPVEVLGDATHPSSYEDAHLQGQGSIHWFLDYFIYVKGMYANSNMPPYAIGGVHHDNWMLWWTIKYSGVLLRAVHQAFIGISISDLVLSLFRV
jgi:hypothetical protein